MYLDQHGSVRACCQNAHHPLGNIKDARLRDIWHSSAARELRRAMERHDLSLGCEFCAWSVEEGRPEAAFSRWFEGLPMSGEEPDWPVQLELSISNTCNLQCIMCNGDWSSSIRAQREHRPPLPTIYGDEFFEDLAEFVPYLQSVKFLGGEPLLASETLRVMDLLIEHGSSARCHVTTNGTQWSPRVERILEKLPVDIAVSVDGATAATYEAIRVGSSWESVQRNLDRFGEYSRRRGTHLSITYCLMTDNWHEFFDFCAMADARGVTCDVNTVTHPPQLSLYRLSGPALASIVDQLDDRDRTRGDELKASRVTWRAELARLRSHLHELREGHSADVLVKRDLIPNPTANGALYAAPTDQHLSEELQVVDVAAFQELAATVLADAFVGDTAQLVLGSDRLISAVVGGERIGLPDPDSLVGSPMESLMGVFVTMRGPLGDVELSREEPVLLRRGSLEFAMGDRNLEVFDTSFADGTRIRAVSVPDVDAEGRVGGSTVHVGILGTGT